MERPYKCNLLQVCYADIHWRKTVFVMALVQDPAIAAPDADVMLPPCGLYSDELPLETDLYFQQLVLLLECFNWLWRDRTDFYARMRRSPGCHTRSQH